MSDAPEVVEARNLLNAGKLNDSAKLQAEVNSTRVLGDADSIKRLNQVLADQEKTDSTLPKLHFEPDGSLVKPNVLPPGQYGPPGLTTYKPQQADGTDTTPNTQLRIGMSDTFVGLNDKGQAVAYYSRTHGSPMVYLEKDGIWKEVSRDHKDEPPKDFGTVAPVMDPNTGALKFPDNSSYCYADEGKVFQGLSLDDQERRRRVDDLANDFLKGMMLVRSIGGKINNLVPQVVRPGIAVQQSINQPY